MTQHNASLQVTEVSEQDRAQFTHKLKAAVNHGIWQTFPRKTVGPVDQFSSVMSLCIRLYKATFIIEKLTIL